MSTAGWYSLKYPHNWVVEEEQGLVTFSEPENGVGALQVSAYETPSTQNCEDILLEYLSDNGIPFSQCNKTVGTASGKCVAGCSYTEDRWFRRVWFISADNHLLMLTYNCKTDHRGKEDREVDRIIDSVSITTDDGERK